MSIDLRTLIIVLGITHLIQFLVFSYQYKINQRFQGIGWWLLWSITEIIGFSFMLVRQIPSLLHLAIIMQNTMIVLGILFVYIGVLRYLGMKENRRLIIASFAVYLLAILYFLFVNDNFSYRGLIVSIALAVISFISAQTLFVNKPRVIATSANICSLVFLIHGGIFSYRAVMIIAGTRVNDFFESTFFNYISFLDAMAVGLAWTFGFIIMLNQQLNAEMTEAKQHFELLFSTSPDGTLITRLTDGVVVDINEGFTVLTGYTRNEVIGKSTLDIPLWKNPEDRQKMAETLREKGVCENFESVFLSKDKGLIDGLVSAKIISLQGVPHILSVTRDVTEHKRAQQALWESEEKFRSLFENMTEGVALHELIYDAQSNPLDYRIVDCNHAFERLTGITVERARGALASKLYGIGFPPYLTEYNGVVHSKKPLTFETHFPPMNKDFSISVVSTKAGHFATIFIDITERKQSEKALQVASQEREKLIQQLQFALDNVKTLQSFLPICANCKKIRDDQGYWTQVESYISMHTDTMFSHSICPDCMQKLYPDI